jgi:poly(A) polymerase
VISAELLAIVRPLAGRFQAAGHGLYLVGGIVRDEILAPGAGTWVDIDLTTDAHPGEIKRLVQPVADAVWTQGERFGTIGCRIDATPFEITTFRGEAYDPASRKPVVSFSTSLAEDLARRDFTINAIAADATTGAIHDPYDGRAHLAARELRTPLGADRSFSDDPLRMLRAARFLARFDLVAASDIDGAIARRRDRLSIVSAERVRDELHKLLAVPDPTRGLRFLVEHRLLDRWLPELRLLAGVHDPTDGGWDAFTHTVEVVRRCPPETTLRLAALLHDAAKSDPSAPNHAAMGAALAERRLRELRHASEDVRAITRLVALHHRLDDDLGGWPAPAVRRVLVDAADDLDALVLLAEANAVARGDRATIAERQRTCAAFGAARRALGEEAHEQRPALDGVAVMAELGVRPGPVVGEAQQFLLELRLERGAMPRDEVLAELRRWFTGRAAGEA